VYVSCLKLKRKIFLQDKSGIAMAVPMRYSCQIQGVLIVMSHGYRLIGSVISIVPMFEFYFVHMKSYNNLHFSM